jgi:hypothetical protein
MSGTSFASFLDMSSDWAIFKARRRVGRRGHSSIGWQNKMICRSVKVHTFHDHVSLVRSGGYVRW